MEEKVKRLEYGYGILGFRVYYYKVKVLRTVFAINSATCFIIFRYMDKLKFHFVPFSCSSKLFYIVIYRNGEPLVRQWRKVKTTPSTVASLERI